MEQLGEFLGHLIFWVWAGLLALVFFVIPVARILKRTGHHPAWSLAFLVPFVAYLGLWIFAFKKWPIDNRLQDN